MTDVGDDYIGGLISDGIEQVTGQSNILIDQMTGLLVGHVHGKLHGDLTPTHVSSQVVDIDTPNGSRVAANAVDDVNIKQMVPDVEVSGVDLPNGKVDVKPEIESGTSSYSLLPGEGEIGTYRDLLDAGEVGDNITPHHMPSAEYMSQYGVGKKDGLCMNMEMPSPGTGGRHRLTDTYGRNMTDAEKAYYYSLSPRDALAYDIANMRQIYQSQGLYSEIRPKLQEYIKQYKELMPELFDK